MIAASAEPYAFGVNTTMSELERFAEHVRITCQKVLAANDAGDRAAVSELAASLAALAADLSARGEMQRDASDPQRYDLTTLPSPDASGGAE